MEPDFNYSSVASLIAAALRSRFPISVLVLKRQAQQVGLPEERIYKQMRKNYQVAADRAEPGCKQDLRSTSGLTGGNAYKTRQVSGSRRDPIGSFLSSAFYRILVASGLNAATGRIVTTPMAGNCGIPPAALPTMQEEKGFSERDCVMSLFTTSVAGIVIVDSTSLADTRGGCQTERGSVAAMATTAIVELASGTPGTVENAIVITTKNILGLACDPVTRLTKIPCIERSASGMVGAFVTAELALARIESTIPAGEVARTMKKVEDAMSSILKEAAEGGLAVTPTGRRLHE